MSDWIRVESKLPEDNVRVLIYLRTNRDSWVIFATLFGGDWMDEDEESLNYYVSHWMPLPPPPT